MPLSVNAQYDQMGTVKIKAGETVLLEVPESFVNEYNNWLGYLSNWSTKNVPDNALHLSNYPSSLFTCKITAYDKLKNYNNAEVHFTYKFTKNLKTYDRDLLWMIELEEETPPTPIQHEEGKYFQVYAADGSYMSFQVLSNTDRTCKLTYSSNESGNITIPATADGYSVVEIGDYIFYKCENITAVHLPSSLKRIGDSVFRGCKRLTSITGYDNLEYICSGSFDDTPWYESFPEGPVYIGKVLYENRGDIPENTHFMVKEGTKGISQYAFYAKNMVEGWYTSLLGLVGVTIPASVENIGDDNYSFAVFDCPNLYTIEVEAGNKIYDSRQGCNAIIEKASSKLIVACNSTVIPSTVKVIGQRSFCYLPAITSITIPDGVETIEDYAFDGCLLESVAIGKSVKSLSPQSFYGHRLKSITVSSANATYDNRDNCNAVIEKGSNKLVMGCSTTVIPATVTTIGEWAFSNLYGDFIIPNNVRKIEEYAFSCVSLTFLTIGSGVTEIDERAFYGVNDLRAVHSLIENPFDIDESVFKSNTWRPDSIYDNATLYVPIGTKQKYERAKGWSKFKNIVEESITATAISLPETATVAMGSTLKLAPQFTPENATAELTWKSRNEAIATVDDNGVVTGIKEGNTFITVETDNGLSAYCKLTVTKPAPPEPTKIEIADELSVSVGQKVKVDYTLTPANAETTVSWTIDDETVATIDEDGILTGKTEGLAVVTAKTANGHTSNLCFITVTPAPEINADVNGDGTVDVADISAVISVMAGQGNQATEKSADVNGDGTVDVADISSVITRMAELARFVSVADTE